MDRIKDPGALASIANNRKTDWHVGEAATRQIRDESLLVTIVANRYLSYPVRLAAIDGLADQTLLEKLLTQIDSNKLKIDIIGKLTAKGRLESLALDKSADLGIRAAAVSRITIDRIDSQELLAAVAITDVLGEPTSLQVTQKLTSQSYLATVANRQPGRLFGRLHSRI